MLVKKRISTRRGAVQDMLDTMSAFDLSCEIEDEEPSPYDGEMMVPISFTGEYESVLEFMMWQLCIPREVAEKMIGVTPPGQHEEAGDNR